MELDELLLASHSELLDRLHKMKLRLYDFHACPSAAQPLVVLHASASTSDSVSSLGAPRSPDEALGVSSVNPVHACMQPPSSCDGLSEMKLRQKLGNQRLKRYVFCRPSSYEFGIPGHEDYCSCFDCYDAMEKFQMRRLVASASEVALPYF